MENKPQKPRKVTFFGKQELVQVSIRLTPATKARLERYSSEHRQSQAAVIEVALKAYLDEHEGIAGRLERLHA